MLTCGDKSYERGPTLALRLHPLTCAQCVGEAQGIMCAIFSVSPDIGQDLAYR